MSGSSEPTLWEGLAAALAKLLPNILPGIAGAIVALRWQPVEATKFDRFVSAVCGFIASIYVAPLIIDVASVSSNRIEAGIVFLTGLFSMVVVGELMLAVRALQLAEIARDTIRSVLRLPPKRGE
jgi:TctA family transporter